MGLGITAFLSGFSVNMTLFGFNCDMDPPTYNCVVVIILLYFEEDGL